jgi:hypothetical protein
MVAQQMLPVLESMVSSVAADKGCTYVIVTLSDGTKLRWWPGNHKWRDGDEIFRGSVSDFIAFVRKAN